MCPSASFSVTSLLLLLVFSLPSLSSSTFFTSCTNLNEEQPWNVESPGDHLRSWLRSGMTVLPFQLDGTTGNIKSRLYDPEKDAFLAHVAGGNNHNHHHHHQHYHQITITITIFIA